MEATITITTGSRQRLADGFWRAAMASLVVLPVGMAIAHRSSPFFIVLSAIFCLAAVALEGRTRSFLQGLSAALFSPLGSVVLLFFGWCLVSIAWSEFKAVSLRAFGEFWLPIAAVLVLGVSLPKRLTPRMFWLVTGAVVLSGIMMMAELQTGMTLRKALGVRSDPYIFNRPVLTLLMLVLPLTAWFIGRSRQGSGLALLLFLGSVIVRSESDAAVLGLAIVCLACPIIWFMPRVAFGLAAFSFLAVVCLSPLSGPIAVQLITPEMHRKIASSHSKERVQVWQSFGYAVREQPVLGSGFGVSPRITDTAVASQVPKEHLRMLNMGHPHNAVLQIWVELGAIGATIFLVIAFLILRAVWQQPHLIRSASLVLLAGAAPVALVGHGAWQGWWAASLGAAILWMQAASRFQTETKL
jgi:O-antigen ligase